MLRPVLPPSKQALSCVRYKWSVYLPDIVYRRYWDDFTFAVGKLSRVCINTTNFLALPRAVLTIGEMRENYANNSTMKKKQPMGVVDIWHRRTHVYIKFSTDVEAFMLFLEPLQVLPYRDLRTSPTTHRHHSVHPTRFVSYDFRGRSAESVVKQCWLQAPAEFRGIGVWCCGWRCGWRILAMTP